MFKPLLIAIFLLVSLGTPARSQPVPSELLRTWVEEQTEEAEALEKIAATETSARMTDGPFGVRRTYVTARIEGDPGTDRWRREVLSVEHADDRGRPSGSPPGRLRHRRAEGPGSPLPPFLEAALFPLRQLARLHPTGPVRPDTTAGLYAWRLELDRGDAPGPVERVTLWFDRRSRALRRSRAIIALPRTGAPLIVTTDYERLEGLDVPRRRLIEGTVRIERRRRPFTLLFEHDATFSDYQFYRRAAP